MILQAAAPPAPAVPGGVRRPLAAVRRVWDRLALYLPLALMGVLALLTYWMVRITPDPAPPQAQRAAGHEVNFFMRGAQIRSYDLQGRLQSQLVGAEIRHYADDASVEVDRPRWQSLTPDGRRTQATARRGLSQDDGSQVQLLGDAVVVREAFTSAQGVRLPRQEFRGEFLHIFAQDERVSSHLPVQFTSGDDQFSADRFHYDHQTRVVELEGRVRARIVPTARPAPTR